MYKRTSLFCFGASFTTCCGTWFGSSNVFCYIRLIFIVHVDKYAIQWTIHGFLLWVLYPWWMDYQRQGPFPCFLTFDHDTDGLRMLQMTRQFHRLWRVHAHRSKSWFEAPSNSFVSQTAHFIWKNALACCSGTTATGTIGGWWFYHSWHHGWDSISKFGSFFCCGMKFHVPFTNLGPFLVLLDIRIGGLWNAPIFGRWRLTRELHRWKVRCGLVANIGPFRLNRALLNLEELELEWNMADS